ncbi:MAG: insulinase family protein [Candidatus Staskawiczbacteria bacterium]|nr:insulinase family protein [Candidatus Staskawiczbacteria bacterium]
MFQKTTFKNGLRLITVPLKNASSVTVLILVGAGSKYETKEVNGISHFLEHMFFKGTEKRPSSLKIAETLDMIGGQYNAFTSKEITGFWAKVDSRHFDIALEWISDMFLNSRFEETEIQKEKGVVIEEMNMYLDTPTVYVTELFEELLYGDQPAGWKVIGEKEHILGLNRQKLLDYYQNHYSPLNTVVCVAGNVDSKAVEGKAQNYFGNIGIKNAKGKIKAREMQKEPQTLLHFKKTDQTHFCLGVRAYDLFHPQRYALSLLSVILGGNMSSRLFVKVREEQGLAYYIHTSADFETDVGRLITQAGIDHKNLEKSVKLILEGYKDLKNKDITAKELQKAKDYLKGTSALSLESSDSQASFYASQELLEGKILNLEEKFKQIDKVSINDIKKVAEDIFLPQNLNLSVIGPLEEKENIQRLLVI